MQILLIDNDELMLNTVGEFLQRLGYEVTLSDGCDALKTAGWSNTPDLIVADNQLDRDYLSDVIASVRRRNPSIATIIMSGLHSILPVQDAVGINVYGYLRKPISLKELELMMVRLEEQVESSVTVGATEA